MYFFSKSYCHNIFIVGINRTYFILYRGGRGKMSVSRTSKYHRQLVREARIWTDIEEYNFRNLITI